MKKLLIFILLGAMFTTPVFAKADKTSAEYLKTSKHFAPMNPVAECFAQKIIKKSLKKETGANFKVKFDGYTLSSMKQGIFKYLEITGKNVDVEGINISYVNLKTLSDYNWVDYTQNPPVMKSDMTFAYELNLSEQAMNQALSTQDYKKSLKKVNDIAYPLFCIKNVRIKVKGDRLYIIMDYNFPIKNSKKDKTFAVSTEFKVSDGKILANNVKLDKAYGNIPLDKITNLVNLLDPLSFTLDLMDSKKCNAKVENVKIEDDFVKINGRIFVKGEV